MPYLKGQGRRKIADLEHTGTRNVSATRKRTGRAMAAHWQILCLARWRPANACYQSDGSSVAVGAATGPCNGCAPRETGRQPRASALEPESGLFTAGKSPAGRPTNYSPISRTSANASSALLSLSLISSITSHSIPRAAPRNFRKSRTSICSACLPRRCPASCDE